MVSPAVTRSSVARALQLAGGMRIHSAVLALTAWCSFSATVLLASSAAAYNPFMLPESKLTITYLQSLAARNLTLSGQHEDIWFDQSIDIVFQDTGKYPAIRGVEVGLCADPARLQEVYQTYLAYGTIPALTWHVVAPNPADKEPGTNIACPDSCSFNCVHDQPVNLQRVITAGTIENTNFNKQLDRVLQQTKFFTDKHVPVIWRPLHEMTNTHFWWGWSNNGTPADFVALWKYVYNYFVFDNPLGIYPDNFIWTWAASYYPGKASPFYPGNAYVDVVGTDLYSTSNGCPGTIPATPKTSYVSLQKAYGDLSDPFYGGKPIALTETDYIPDTDKLISNGIKFAWFMAWEGQYLRCNLGSTVPSIGDLYSRANMISSPNMGDQFGVAIPLTGPTTAAPSGSTTTSLDTTPTTFNNDYDNVKYPNWGLCAGSPGPESVFRIDVPWGTTSHVTLSTAGTSYDTVLYVMDVYNRMEGCNDDALGAGGVSGLASYVTATLGGGTHYVVVDGYWSTSRGPTSLKVTYQP